MRIRDGLIAIIAIAMACAPAGIGTTTVWSEPSLPRERFQRIMTVFVSTDDELRRLVELDMARRVGNGTPAYLVISGDHRSNEELVRRRVRQSGFDAVLMTRLVGVRPDTTSAVEDGRPAPAADGFWGYWDGAWSTVESPNDPAMVAVESALYSVAPDRLLWAGRSAALSLTKARSHVTDVVIAATAEMRRQRLF